MTAETRTTLATVVTLTALAVVADLAVVAILPRFGAVALVFSLWGVIGIVVIGAYRVGRARPGGAS